MSSPALWLGPAIVAAFISGLVSLIVVQLNFRAGLRTEKLRRDEKVRDFQIALRAEIASDLVQMKETDRALLFDQVADATAADPAYVPALPRLSPNPIFDVVVKDMPILPGDVIAPVVHYERLRQTLGQFIEDLRSSQYKELPPQRRLLAYGDYVATYDRVQALADEAMRALDASLALSRTDEGRSKPAAAKGEASAGDSSS